ncbi:hypothetical protein SRB5_01780 [Streptomyces sp. RB5]|uniref:Copper transporter n=1 Tax=Streptomyces smaragdinus TaxID=2585196 RepID=A0A7K0CBB6_9ACTN|nr:bagremycin/ferroverdin biosynthesis copper chaperon BagZ/FevE [Streptomyces smaragdinus]MQY10074.1 hypothetical protein [Streptomyces smaragdinus]
MKRRDVMRGMAGVAAVTLPIAAVHAGTTWADAHDKAATDPSATEHDHHTETYRGRTITVSHADGAVTIDGRPLHVMKLGDGAYLSALCHYKLAPSPLAAGRHAVDELRGADLLATGTHHA